MEPSIELSLGILTEQPGRTVVGHFPALDQECDHSAQTVVGDVDCRQQE